ncbi:MAG: hypothetical protein ACPGJX_14380, partial [Alloalcanivorax venustensis]
DIHADEDVELTEGSVLDVAGREVTFFDVTRHSFGGDVVLESRQGDVRQAAGATLVKPGHRAHWGGYLGYFSDPDGFLWEVAHNPEFWVGPEDS